MHGSGDIAVDPEGIHADYCKDCRHVLYPITLIITTMNEKRALQSIWPEIPFELFKRIIILDNHSTDGTLEWLTNDGKFSKYKCQIIQQQNNGRGNGIQEAMQLVESHQDAAVMLMSSDGNDLPEYIPEVISKFNEGYDLVFGTRFVEGGASDNSDDPFRIRCFGNRILTGLVNLFFGTHYSDSTYGGFRLFRKSTWDRMSIHVKKNETEYLMSIRGGKLGLKVAQIPMIEGRRVGGEVKAKTWQTGLELLGVLLKEAWRS
jgi:glycosyltransferase involved in cell wall biosynthesis